MGDKTLLCVLVSILLVFVMHPLSCFGGHELIVGGNAGWRSSSGMNYQQWANSNTYHPGDTLVFEGTYDQVVELSQHDYTTCNMFHAKYQNYKNDNTNGKTIIKLINHGIHYFSSNIQDECKHGMKFTINVQPSHDDIPSKFPQNFPPMDEAPTNIVYPPPPYVYQSTSPIPYSPPSTTINYPPLPLNSPSLNNPIIESPPYPPPYYPNPTNPSITNNQNPLGSSYPSNNPYNGYNNNNNMATSTISSFNITLMVIVGSILHGFLSMHFL